MSEIWILLILLKFVPTLENQDLKLMVQIELPSSSVITLTGLLASLSPNAFTADMRREYFVFGVNPFTDHETSEAGIVISLRFVPRFLPAKYKRDFFL